MISAEMEDHEDNDHISSHTTSPSENQEWGNLLEVSYLLRNVEPNAFTPKLVSIGPYHRNLPRLREMEVYKKRCLQVIKRQIDNDHLDRCLQGWKMKQVRKCYSASLEMGESEFEKMLLLDGCFLIQLLCFGLHDVDPIFKLEWVLHSLVSDILILENQLPFFVLVDLIDMIVPRLPTSGEYCFAYQVFSIISSTLPGPKKGLDSALCTISNHNIKHLLHLLHDNWSPSFQGIQRRQDYCNRNKEMETQLTLTRPTHIDNKIFKRKLQLNAVGKKNMKQLLKSKLYLETIPCATQLNDEARIHFMNNTDESNVTSLFDIEFTHSTLKIPFLYIDDKIKYLLFNLVAFEKYANGSTYVSDYMKLMDDLIDSPKDVQLLRESEVIHNGLGDDEVLSQMFNNLGLQMMHDGNFYYQETYVDIFEHCTRSQTIWKAKLIKWMAIFKHDYFNSPWAVISLLGALLLILLTIAQVVFGALSL